VSSARLPTKSSGTLPGCKLLSIIIRGSPLRYDPRTVWQPAGLSRQSGGMELVIKKERGRHEKMSKLQTAVIDRRYNRQDRGRFDPVRD